MPNSEHVLIVGCGDLGAYLAKLLSANHFQVTGLSRSKKSILGVNSLVADVTNPESLSDLTNLNPSMIIYSVAANGQTDAQYQAHYVDGLKNILNTQQQNKHLKVVAFISSTRVYGQNVDELLDENSTPIPCDFGGERLLEAENLLLACHCQTIILRLSGIYGPGRLRMLNLAQSPERWPQKNAWSNRIHRDDAAGFIAYLIKKINAGEKVNSCYIVTDSQPVSQYEVLNWLALKLNVNASKPIFPISEGKRLSNQSMVNSGFNLKYAHYQAGYLSLINQTI